MNDYKIMGRSIWQMKANYKQIKTTITISRLKRRGYMEFREYFKRFSQTDSYKLDFDFH